MERTRRNAYVQQPLQGSVMGTAIASEQAINRLRQNSLRTGNYQGNLSGRQPAALGAILWRKTKKGFSGSRPSIALTMIVSARWLFGLAASQQRIPLAIVAPWPRSAARSADCSTEVRIFQQMFNGSLFGLKYLPPLMRRWMERAVDHRQTSLPPSSARKIGAPLLPSPENWAALLHFQTTTACCPAGH